MVRTTGASLVSSSIARVPSTSSEATDTDDNRVNDAWPTMLDGDETMRSIAVGPVQGQQTTLRIDVVTAPGDPRFDRAAISEVRILG